MLIFGKKDRPEIMCLFFRQLASMLKAGVGIREALDILGDVNEDKDVQQLAMNIHGEQGKAERFMRPYPGWFRHLLDHILALDKPDKNLPDMIFGIANDHETMEDMKSRFKSVLIYPASILIFAGFVMSVVLIFVIPSFVEMFQSSGSSLPGPTRFVIHFSNWVSNYLGFIVVGILGAAILMLNREGFRDRVLVMIPGVNSIIKTLTMIRFSRYLAMMLALGMPLKKALDAAIIAIPNRVYADKVRQAVEQVEETETIFEALKKTGLYSNMAMRIIAAGEKTGSLSNALQGLAQYYEKSKVASIEGTSRVFEITVMVSVAVIIGFFVIAMYLPIFMMAGAVG